MNKRLLQADDLLRLRFVGDPQVSPEKDAIAYVLTEMDREKDGYFSSVYVSDFSGHNKQLTSYDNDDRLIKDTAPRWSPDGKHLTFLSNRSGTSQLWMMSKQGGEATRLATVPGKVRDYTWANNGEWIALTVEEAESNGNSDVQIITRLRYKMDGRTGFLNSRTHMYILDIKTLQCEKVTTGNYDFYGGHFSADSTKLYYLGSKKKDRELHDIPSIWAYDIDSQEETLFYEGKGPMSSLSASPDGKWIGCIGHDQGEQGSSHAKVWIISTETKQAINVSKQLDRSVSNVIRVDANYETGKQQIIWDDQSTSVYFLAMDHGNIHLYKTTIDGEVSEPLTEDQQTMTSFDLIDSEQAVFVRAHAHSTGDLIIQSLNHPGEQIQLTHWNEKLFNDIHLSTPEHLTYQSVDGLNIEGWLLPPVNRKDNQKYPLILQIHGGPHSAYGYGFQHEWQLLAAKGYAVLYTNPRGSQSYDEAFLRQVVGDWAGKDYEDLMQGVDVALEKYTYIDEENIFVTGASYGGYMTNMITTRTDRFKAAITQNSISNLYSMFGTSDIGFYFTSWQLGGLDLWEDEEKIMAFSPIRYAKNVQTPTLIMHNEDDDRCPIEQGEQWYVALRRLGVEAQFVRIPGESHGLASSGKPSHRLERLKHMINWFDYYKQVK